jgi:hypothetical protein
VALKNVAPWGHFGRLNVVHLGGEGVLCAHALLLPLPPQPLLRHRPEVCGPATPSVRSS